MFPLHEGTGIRCIKFSLIFFSVGLVITGMSLIIIGTTINSIYEEFSSFLATIYFSPATFLVSVGFIIFGIACLGCIGAIKESPFTITAFGILLGMVSVLQLCAGLSNNFLMSYMDVEVAHNLNKTVYTYFQSQESQKILDNLQQEIHCCGMSGPRDWQLIYGKNVPKSCCANGADYECTTTYNNGCHIILRNIFIESSKILTFSAYLLAFSEVMGMVFSFFLARVLKAQQLAREYRRWAIRSQLLNTSIHDPYGFDLKHPYSSLSRSKLSKDF